MEREIKSLKTANNKSLYIDDDKLIDIKQELEDFLKDEKEMNTLKFSEKVMYSQEVKTNNDIEGYFDDLSFIETVIKNNNNQNMEDKKTRILNLYKGYKYILQRKEINKDNLRELYSILSKGLLNDFDINHMGTYYRKDEVIISLTNILTNYEQQYIVDIRGKKIKLYENGVDYHHLDNLMDNLFTYLNDNSNLNNKTDYYIKSQIAHFYFVYLHPYFDINGRTSRTTSMWYLLNNEVYPYIIFNRAIENSKPIYYKQIERVRETHLLTEFIEYLMIYTKKELEKEYIIQNIKNSTNEKLESIDYATILTILSMNGLKTLKDFCLIYSNKNGKKRHMKFIMK